MTLMKLPQTMNKWRGAAVGVAFCLTILMVPLMAKNGTTGRTPIAPPGGWRLVWSDEFDQPEGSSPDPAKWGYDIGGNGWGNKELEYYTSRTNNVRIEDGKLVIEARQEPFNGKSITSARLLTKGKWSWTYGRVEARIKIPRGQGVWPAFWMLGTNIGTVGWPACGEIDIMENIGREPGTAHGTVHGPGYSGDSGIGGPVTLPGGATVADGFHVFAIECEPERIAWFMDGRQYFSITLASLPKNTRWVFNQPKFLLLNLAIGGAWPGYPDATSTFPQRMIVDYVRVYEKSTPSESMDSSPPQQADSKPAGL
jgi:beta-glucanase (GH16 family)